MRPEKLIKYNSCEHATHTHTTMSQNITDFLFTATHVVGHRVLQSWCRISYCSELDVVEMDSKGLSNFNKGKVIIAICQGQRRATASEMKLL